MVKHTLDANVNMRGNALSGLKGTKNWNSVVPKKKEGGNHNYRWSMNQ